MSEIIKALEGLRIEREKIYSKANRIEIDDIGEYIGKSAAEKLYNEQISKKLDSNNLNLIIFPTDNRIKDKEFCIEFIKILISDNNIQKTDFFKYFQTIGNVGNVIKATLIQCSDEI